MKHTLYKGDCLEVMKNIEDKSIDLILCDLPYGTTACEWDNVIDLELLWKHYKRIIQPSGIIVLTASQPFTSILTVSNLSWFNYSLVWEKEMGTNFLSCKYMPLKSHEDILVFSNTNDIGKNEELRQYFYNEKIRGGFTNKQINEMLGYSTKGSGMAGHFFKKDKQQFSIPKEKDYIKLQETGYFQKPYYEIKEMYDCKTNKKIYNPQMEKGKAYKIKQGSGSEVYNNKENNIVTENNGERYPKSVLKFNRDKNKLHPTQKPVKLLEYLIKTYTNENMTVLDNCMGSNSTGIACINTNRNYIGIEKDDTYFDLAIDRTKKHIQDNNIECELEIID